MISIDFSNATPYVAFTYDRVGRVLSATNSAAAYFYAYDAFGRLTNEVGPYATLARHYDDLGRSIGYDLLDGYAGTLSRVRYEYADGRFVAVVWTNRGESTGYRADYSYLAGSGLLAALTNSSGMTWTRGYEAHRDLLTAVENRNGTNLLSRYEYANDALGRRTDRLDAPGSVQNSFDYNERSELISAQMGTNVYAYEFDPIGNRRSASRLEAAAAMTNLYASNPLNQYTNILHQPSAYSLQPSYDADGSAPSEARRFLRGESPCRVRISHPLVPSVGTVEEESHPNDIV